MPLAFEVLGVVPLALGLWVHLPTPEAAVYREAGLLVVERHEPPPPSLADRVRDRLRRLWP
jgi:hypothetical protein